MASKLVQEDDILSPERSSPLLLSNSVFRLESAADYAPYLMSSLMPEDDLPWKIEHTSASSAR